MNGTCNIHIILYSYSLLLGLSFCSAERVWFLTQCWLKQVHQVVLGRKQLNLTIWLCGSALTDGKDIAYQNQSSAYVSAFRQLNQSKWWRLFCITRLTHVDVHYSKKLKDHVDIMIFIERYPLKRCQGCVKLIASKVNCFLNITDLSKVQLCMSSNSWTWECPHTKDGADHVPLIFLSSVLWKCFVLILITHDHTCKSWLLIIIWCFRNCYSLGTFILQISSVTLIFIRTFCLILKQKQCVILFGKVL